MPRNAFRLLTLTLHRATINVRLSRATINVRFLQNPLWQSHLASQPLTQLIPCYPAKLTDPLTDRSLKSIQINHSRNLADIYRGTNAQ